MDAKSDVTRVAAAASVVRATVTHIFVGRSIPHDSNTSHLNHSGAGVTTYDANILPSPAAPPPSPAYLSS